MDRMTREEIEAVWLDVKRLYEHSVPNVYPAAYERLRKPFDLALQALDREAVLEEEFDTLHKQLTEVRATVDEIETILDGRALKRKPSAAPTSAEKGGTHAAHSAADSVTGAAHPNNAVSAPDVAEKWVFWEKSDGYAVGPRNVGALAIVFTWDEAAALCAAANTLLARLGQERPAIHIDYKRVENVTVSGAYISPPAPGASDE